MKDRETLMGSDGSALASTQEMSHPASPGDPERGPPGPVPVDEQDAPILTAISAGRTDEALRLCVSRHGAAVGRLCMALVGSQAEADDLTQDTLLAARDAFSGYRAEGSPRAWLLGIARRKCARHLERRSLRESKLRVVREATATPTSDELLLVHQRAELARRALEQVRPTEREALLLRYVGELSYREVAHACGIDEAAARKRVSRAIGRLRSALGDQE